MPDNLEVLRRTFLHASSRLAPGAELLSSALALRPLALLLLLLPQVTATDYVIIDRARRLLLQLRDAVEAEVSTAPSDGAIIAKRDAARYRRLAKRLSVSSWRRLLTTGKT